MTRIIAALLLTVALVPTAGFAATTPKEASPRDDNHAADSHDTKFEILKPGEFDAAYQNYMVGRYTTAFHLALPRGENGDPRAQTLLARLYMEGNAVAPDGARSALWYSRAAALGDPQAQLRYGLLLFNGSFVTRDQKKGEDYVHQAAEAGVPEAFFYYGSLLMNKVGGEPAADVGLTWFLKGVAAGDPDSAYAAAKILAHGTPKVAKDEKAARKLLEMAAAKDHAPAQVELANWMINGRGGPRDYDNAFNYDLLNATRGFTPAQINLARLYRDGMGTEGDTVKAAAWYMVAQKANMIAPDLDDLIEGLSAEQLEKARSLSLYYQPNLIPPPAKIAKN